MSEPSQNYMLADMSMASDLQKEALNALPGMGEAALIGDAPNLQAIPLRPGDEAATHALVAEGAGIFVTSQLAPQMLGERLGERLYYFHPATGRLGSYSLCVPMILSFFLLNAGPALAGHLTADLSRVVTRGYQDSVFNFTRAGDALTAKLVYPVSGAVFQNELTLPDTLRATPVKQIESNTWVVHACQIDDPSQLETTYGSFPELTQDFIAAFEVFQRRICVREFADQQVPYLKTPFSTELEAQLLDMARRCGYWDELPFSSFAYSYLILGGENLRTDRNFKCNPDTHPNEAMLDIETVRTMSADIRVRNVKKYGPDWGKDE